MFLRLGWWTAAVTLISLSRISASCAYGHAPGHWVELDGQPVWQLFNPRCQLGRRVVDWRDGGLHRAISILLIGDSTDRLMHVNLCQDERVKEAEDPSRDPVVLRGGGTYYGDPLSSSPWFDCSDCTLCVLGSVKDVPEGEDPLSDRSWRRLTIGHRYVWGVHATGPYRWDRQGTAKERSDEVIAVFRNLTGGDPDAVVFASGFWDLGRMYANDHNIFVNDAFDPPTLLEWQKHLGDILTHLRAALPNAVGIFRTQAHPMPKDCDSGENNNTELGKKAHIVQLNAAGRYVASEHHWHVVDVEPMIAGFGHPKDYLIDSVHQMPFLSIEIVNIYLNIIGSELK